LKPDPKHQLGSAAEEAEMNQIESSTRDTEQTACGDAVNLSYCPHPAPYSPADNVANIFLFLFLSNKNETNHFYDYVVFMAPYVHISGFSLGRAARCHKSSHYFCIFF
jgi:hypothetical protein